MRIEVNDRMQRGYVYWLTEPVGQKFLSEFQPDLTPKQMLELGVFGGKYMTDCTAEYPMEWFVEAKLCPERYDPDLNFFGVNASQPLSVWRDKNWIYDEDPRGWFQWYCRYFLDAPRTTSGRSSVGGLSAAMSPSFRRTIDEAI